jgi:hypothetical protein
MVRALRFEPNNRVWQAALALTERPTPQVGQDWILSPPSTFIIIIIIIIITVTTIITDTPCRAGGAATTTTTTTTTTTPPAPTHERGTRRTGDRSDATGADTHHHGESADADRLPPPSLRDKRLSQVARLPVRVP